MFWYKDPNINTYESGRGTQNLEKVYLKDLSKPMIKILHGGDHPENGSVWDG